MTERTMEVPQARSLPLNSGLADLLRPELPSLADEIVDEIRVAVPEFARPLQGKFGQGLRLGVEHGLRQFVDQIADPAASQDQSLKVYRALGRGEFLEGRSLDALQAAYRIGARVAWRRFSGLGQRAEIPPQQMYVLAERVFAFIEEVSARSVEAFSELRARIASTVDRRRHRLMQLLLVESAVAAPAMVVELAGEAQWRLPRTVACVAVDEQWQAEGRLSPALSPDVLADLERPDPCLLVPDPAGPGRVDMLRRGLHYTDFAIGPTVPLGDAAVSLRLARQALSLMRRGVIQGDGHVRCEDHLPTLLLLSNEEAMRLLTRRALAGFAELNHDQFERLAETLLAWLTTGASFPEVATRLAVHPQTIRYRMRRLEDLFGECLHDPGWRFEMELVLRARTLLTVKPDRDAAAAPVI